jgi:hypothetical protein
MKAIKCIMLSSILDRKQSLSLTDYVNQNCVTKHILGISNNSDCWIVITTVLQ